MVLSFFWCSTSLVSGINCLTVWEIRLSLSLYWRLWMLLKNSSCLLFTNFDATVGHYKLVVLNPSVVFQNGVIVALSLHLMWTTDAAGLRGSALSQRRRVLGRREARGCHGNNHDPRWHLYSWLHVLLGKDFTQSSGAWPVRTSQHGCRCHRLGTGLRRPHLCRSRWSTACCLCYFKHLLYFKCSLKTFFCETFRPSSNCRAPL